MVDDRAPASVLSYLIPGRNGSPIGKNTGQPPFLRFAPEVLPDLTIMEFTA